MLHQGVVAESENASSVPSPKCMRTFVPFLAGSQLHLTSAITIKCCHCWCFLRHNSLRPRSSLTFLVVCRSPARDLRRYTYGFGSPRETRNEDNVAKRSTVFWKPGGTPLKRTHTHTHTHAHTAVTRTTRSATAATAVL